MMATTKSLFLENQPKQQIADYTHYLQILCSLSKLFSENKMPYLPYRAAENIFCIAFGADNLSRSDCSADARKGSMGMGLKTFLNGNGHTFQKVAEFNKERKNYGTILDSADELIHRISALRNERIELTKRAHGIGDMIYHCAARDGQGLLIYESPMDLIDINSIKNIQKKDSIISFQDRCNEYTFSISKSTLSKRFSTPQNFYRVPASILENPLQLLSGLAQESTALFEPAPLQSVCLPLYSTRLEGEVPEKSGLNQWNASGRIRDRDEVYIPVPAWLHRDFKGFFPPKDHIFKLILPDKKELRAKICQVGGKALMSNPNKDLGDWILRKVLRLKQGQLLTYDDLENLGIDSVRIDKIDNETYCVNFAELGTYEQFENENKK